MEQDKSFVLVRKRREYTSDARNPKISVDRGTYDRLAGIAAETDLTMAKIAVQAVNCALDHLKLVDAE